MPSLYSLHKTPTAEDFLDYTHAVIFLERSTWNPCSESNPLQLMKKLKLICMVNIVTIISPQMCHY
ncbi:MAG: hypothetical protein ACI90V_010741 [Bacillariaceae sp.]|jgi:hypothetical protein